MRQARSTNGQNGFQRLAVNRASDANALNNEDGVPGSAGNELASTDLNQSASDSFVVNGSVSSGLNLPQQNDWFGRGGGFGPGGPGGFDGSDGALIAGSGGPAGGPGGPGGPGVVAWAGPAGLAAAAADAEAAASEVRAGTGVAAPRISPPLAMAAAIVGRSTAATWR